MAHETTSHLAQSRTFQISSTTGDVIEIDLLGGAAPAIDLTGTTIDSKYQILQLLGRGGMGAVYRARHLMLNKDIALKTVISNRPSVQAIERFNREVRAVAKLGHPNVVLVFDSGITESNQPYYTMELLVGQSLEERLASRGPLSIDEALSIFTEVAEGLKSAHNNGIVHRDLKPANIFLSTAKTQSSSRTAAKVVDFGIAKLADNAQSRQYQTAAGTIFGSPLYMSPEQSRGEEVDKRSDIYSFGCALYEALTGLPPLAGNHAFETMIMHQTKAPPRLSQRAPGKTFPAMLESFVGRLLHKSPEHRPQSFEEIIDTFRRIQKMRESESVSTADKTESPAAKRTLIKPLLLLLTTFLIAVLSTAAWLLVPGRPPTKNASRPAAETRAPARENTEKKSPGKDDNLDSPDSFLILVGRPSAIKPTPAQKITINRNEDEFKSFCQIISPENFDVISKSQITRLSLSRCIFESSQLKKLAGMRLQSIDLSITEFNDSDAETLAACKYLTKVKIDGSKITDIGCLSLSKITPLANLDLSRTKITDKGLTYLSKLPNLYELRLSDDGITINGVTRLCEQCRSLKTLFIGGCCLLSPAEISKLAALFPQIRIRTDDDRFKNNDPKAFFNYQK